NYLPADARIFSRAIVPAEPYFPKPLPIAGAAFVGSLLVMAIVTLLQELFSGRAMRPAAGSKLRADSEIVESHAGPVASEAIERDEPIGATPEPAAVEPLDIEPERGIAAAAETVEAAPVEPKPALAEEIDLSKPTVAVPAFAEIIPVPGKAEPVKHEPLPEMKVERESFSEAWARHKRIMDAAKHDAFAAEPVE